MGLLPSGQTFGTQVAFFNHSFASGGKFRCYFCDKGPGIPEVETSGTIGAGSHAESASDTAMKIHEHNAVFPFKGCLGRACLDTGGIFAMVAKG